MSEPPRRGTGSGRPPACGAGLRRPPGQVVATPSTDPTVYVTAAATAATYTVGSLLGVATT